MSGTATIYQHANFTGSGQRLTPGDYNTNALSVGNDQISSLIVDDDVQVRLYGDTNFSGGILCLSGGMAGHIEDRSGAIRVWRLAGDGRYTDLKPSPFNDQTSSIVVARGVTIYQHADYQGARVTLPIGRHTVDGARVTSAYRAWWEDLARYRAGLAAGIDSDPKPSSTFRGPWPMLLDNDSLSSVVVPQGLYVELSQHADRSGGRLTLCRTTNFVGASWNDQASAADVDEAVVIFEAANYEGGWANLAPGNYPNPSALGLTNDTLSSVKVPASLSVTLYEHDNYQGASISLSSDTPYVGASFNDRASSARVTLRLRW